MFKKIYIELSDICGLKCSFCPAPKGRRGVMSLELFERIAQQISGFKGVVALHLLGDPLWLKNLAEYLQIAKTHHLKIEIVTSGFYLHRWDFSFLLSAPIIQLNFSLSAFSDPCNPKPKDYFQNLLALCDFHQRSKSEVFINLRMHQSRIQSEFVEIFAKHFGLSEVEMKNERLRLGYKIFLRMTKDFEWVRAEQGRSNVVQKEKFCYGLISQIAFLANGKVVPCCMDCDGGIVLGEIAEQNLKEILDSPRAKKIARGFLQGIATEEQCQRCTYRATLQA